MLDRQLVSSQTQSSIPGVSRQEVCVCVCGGGGGCPNELCALERNVNVSMSPSYNCASCFAVKKKKKF
jgi:hypothetical protein